MIRLEEYGISRERARELTWACRQYDQYRKKAAAVRRGEPVDERPRRGNKAWRPHDPTGDAAMRMADDRYARRVKAIEDSARAAEPSMWRQIIRNVCRGVPFAYLDAPCSKRYFDRVRRMFYVELDARL